MGSSESLMIIIVGIVLLVGPIVIFILSLIAYVRSRNILQLTMRVAELERRLASLLVPESSPSPRVIPADVGPSRFKAATAAEPVVVTPISVPSTPMSTIQWETFIGQKAFGWIAVVLFVLASAFFLRYAYQNNWIGPVGRVTISELVGIGLVAAGWRYMRQGMKRFSNMLTAAGIIVLYLATYSAFGFYQLLPQQTAGIFLGILVAESMVLAVLYRSQIVAVVATLGGLVTPLLMTSTIDQYSALFIYLAVLNSAVVFIVGLRGWSVVSWVAYLGTQCLFGMWYDTNYHPEKFEWCLGFQLVLFGLYFFQSLIIHWYQRRSLTPSELVLFVVNAIVGGLVLRVLLNDSYRDWLGILALVMATLLAINAKFSLTGIVRDSRFSLISSGLSLGYIASAIALQADASWISLGWAAMGCALWWFGLRIETPLLRAIAGVLAVAALSRLLIADLSLTVRDPFIPIFNREALPSLGVAAFILAGVVWADGYLKRLAQAEQTLIAVAGVTGVLLLWLILSNECYGFFLSQSMGDGEIGIEVWRWRGQLALTVFWSAFATAILVLGFQLDRARLRWLAIAIFGITVAKVFIVDMANVQQIYRILVFFILAIVLGLVARAYQRMQ